MSETPPNPPAQQPRYFTGVDLFWELVSAAVVCGGFYAGYLLKGFWVGLFCGLGARVLFIVFMMFMHDLVNRRSEERERHP